MSSIQGGFTRLGFVECVSECIDQFLEVSGHLKSVLIFPPCDNFRRFLIHDLVTEKLKKERLASFSIGSDSQRRVVVVYKKYVKNQTENEPSSSHTTEENDDSWQTSCDESGNRLEATSMDEITSKVGKTRICYLSPTEKIQFESLMENVDPNVLELFNNTNLATSDVKTSLDFYLQRGLYLKWVDERHAIAVFPCASMAEEVLRTKWATFDVLPLSKGTSASKEAARTLELPSSMRPRTNPSVMKRLVAGALGIKAPMSDKEKDEKKLLNDAKEEKIHADSQKKVAEEGTLKTNAVKILQSKRDKLDVLPLSKGTSASKEATCPLELTSSKRPRTNPILMKRLITQALGIKVPISDEEKTEEKKLLNDAKEEKIHADSQKKVAEEGTIKTNTVKILQSKRDKSDVLPLSKGTSASKEAACPLELPSSMRPRTNPTLMKRLITQALGIKVPISDEEKTEEKKLLNDAKEEKIHADSQKKVADEGTLKTNEEKNSC